MNPHELKALQVRLTKAEADAKSAKNSAAVANRAADAAAKVVAQIKEQIQQASTEPTVTEHALLRYIERTYGVDLEEIRKTILTPTTVSAIKALGSGKYPLPCGGKAVVKGMAIISVVDA